jgi:hypothetical protein
MTPTQILRIWRADVRRWHHNTDHRLRESGDANQEHQARVAQLVALIFPDILVAIFGLPGEEPLGDRFHFFHGEFASRSSDFDSPLRVDVW